jgi:2-polyprenyl-3-methyl-5-hydroxy-6-metoxy-1,4-benzoquinol methylase
MIRINSRVQKEHFSKTINQYRSGLIYNPPTHTQEEIKALISLIPKKSKVIDFGAGTGRLTIPLLLGGYEVTAVDISQNSLLELRKIANHLSLDVRTTKNLNGIKNYGVVIGSDILHHVELQKEMKEIFRVLKNNGTLVFSEPNALNPSWYLYFLVKGIWKYEKGVLNMRPKKIKRILENCGFDKIKIIGLGLLPRIIFQNKYLCRLNDLLGNVPIFKFFAYRFIIVARKST